MRSLSVDELLEEISEWKVAVYASAPPAYLEAVAKPWFETIAPERAAAYGVLGLNELGLTGVIFQVLNCYFRWRHLEDEGTGWSGICDTVRDALGYAVLAGVVSGTPPSRVGAWEKLWQSGGADVWYKDLKNAHGSQGSIAFRLAVAMYNDTSHVKKG